MFSPFLLLYLLPKNLLSFFVGKLVLIRHPRFLARFALRLFVRSFAIKSGEAEKDLSEYDCIGDFFIRKLRADARSIEGEIVSPVDGIHRRSAVIEAGTLIQAKGRHYTLAHLLGSEKYAKRFEKGSYSNLYLSPRHYHRVHAPLSGKVIAFEHIPGMLWPVNDWSIENIANLFCVNERVITYIQSEKGLVAVVMVGATNVGKMSLEFHPLLTNQKPFSKVSGQYIVFEESKDIAAGDPLGIFHMGSTVIVLFENAIECQLNAQQEIRMGEQLTVEKS